MIEVALTHSHTHTLTLTCVHTLSLSPGIKPCYVVFDVLMINDDNLANIALRDRVKRLNK